MKNLLPLLAAMLLWSTEAVAQNFLRIWTSDSTVTVPMADLDSITIRDTKFYENALGRFNGAHFVASAIPNSSGATYDFDVTLALSPTEKDVVYIKNLDPYFKMYGYTADLGYNVLIGHAKTNADGKTVEITCPIAQKMGYSDTEFRSYMNFDAPITFTVNVETMELVCNTGYNVYSPSQGGFYIAFQPFILQCHQLPVTARRKPAHHTMVLSKPQPKESDKQETIEIKPSNTSSLIIE